MKVVSLREAAQLVPHGATVAICGSARVGVPEGVLAALGERYRANREPGELTLFFPVEAGHKPGIGIDHLANPGMISCIIAGSYIFTGSAEPAHTTRLVMENKVAAYNLPMGVMYLLLRDIAAGRPGHLTDVGLDTFVDPDRGGGKLTSLATRDLVKKVWIDGAPFLHYLPIKIDVAIIRGTTADERGNISLENEASLQGMFAMAQAAKACGGMVIAEVQRLVAPGTLQPYDVRIPGQFVDAVVVNSAQQQLLGENFVPELCTAGVIQNRSSLEPDPSSLATRIIVRRAAAELQKGGRYNVGYGMGANLPSYQREAIKRGDLTFFVEQGAVGGIPLNGTHFGTARWPSALIDMPSWFDYLESGAFTATFLGFGQADAEGSVNNHRVGNQVPGCGGFIDITARVPRIIFCGTFTAGGLEVAWEANQLTVVAEGRHEKFVKHIASPTLYGPRCLRRGQEVTWITERAVLELTRDGLTVKEIAPGVAAADLEKAAGCELRFSPRVTEMDPSLFADAASSDQV